MTHFCVVFEDCVWIIVRLKVGVDRLSAWPIIGADFKHFYDYQYLHFQNWCAVKIIKFWNALFGSNAACWNSPLCGPEQSPPTAHLICWESHVGMGTETQYLIGPGAKLWKTGVSISSDVNGSAIGTGKIKKTHIHLLLLYIYIYIYTHYLSHQSCQLFLYAIIFKHLSMMHFCNSQFRSEIALMRRSFSMRNMKAV